MGVLQRRPHGGRRPAGAARANLSPLRPQGEALISLLRRVATDGGGNCGGSGGNCGGGRSGGRGGGGSCGSSTVTLALLVFTAVMVKCCHHIITLQPPGQGR